MSNLKKDTYDLIVIGGGSGGVRGARWAASLGAKVALCESGQLGGTCVVRGCIPKKLMVYAAHFHEEVAAASFYGWSYERKKFAWDQLKKNRDQEIARLSGVYQNLLEKSGVDLYRGEAHLAGPRMVQVGGTALQGKNILLATGGKAARPSIPGAELGIISDDVFLLEDRPPRIVIVGGGYIGLEFASVFAGLGTKVEVVLRGKRVLKDFDEECAHFLEKEMEKKGITFHREGVLTRLEKNSSGSLTLHAIQQGQDLLLETDCVLFATGRSPRTAGLNLEQLGIKTTKNGAIPVNNHFQTSHPHIYAVGDCLDQVNLTPVALAQAMVVADALFGQGEKKFEAAKIPTAVFTLPPLSTVGLSEQEAKKHYEELDIYTADFRPLKMTLTDLKERTLMKMIVDPKTDQVLGCHMVGQDAPEIMQGLGVALQAGATKKVFDQTLGIHPTSAEEFVTMRTKTRTIRSNSSTEKDF